MIAMSKLASTIGITKENVKRRKSCFPGNSVYPSMIEKRRPKLKTKFPKRESPQTAFGVSRHKT
jgi:hypothetical protein